MGDHSLSGMLVLMLGAAVAQQPGNLKKEENPTMTLKECTLAGGCVSKQAKLVLDSNWRWVHSTSGHENCYTGASWNSAICTDPASCAQNCALEGVSKADYAGTYGITEIDGGVKLDFVTEHQRGVNVGSRLYLMDDSGETYKLFYLKNREFSMDIDVSHLQCGTNGAMYFVEMDQHGGKGKGNNQAGAKYGTGYCDAQCPHDIKFIDGEANVLGWHPNPKDKSNNMGIGKYGTCCAEMDIWEANSMATAYTPHPCSVDGQLRCEGIECGDNDKNERYEGVCDKDGCDINPFRMGDETFYGRGPGFAVDTTKPMTVVTQFLTIDGSDEGDLSEIRRIYVQDGHIIHSPPSKILGEKNSDSITDGFCAAKKELFDDVNDFQANGGNAAMGKSLDRGHVLAVSLWDDVDANMLWLDSAYPLDKNVMEPGVRRGTCPGGESSTPTYVRDTYPDAYVLFANAAIGEINSTLIGSTGPFPTTPAPPCLEQCSSAPAQNTPECNGQTKERCQQIMQYENKCQWAECHDTTPMPSTDLPTTTLVTPGTHMTLADIPHGYRCKGAPLSGWGGLGSELSPQQCQDACLADPQCMFAVYKTGNGKCSSFRHCSDHLLQAGFVVWEKTSAATTGTSTVALTTSTTVTSFSEPPCAREAQMNACVSQGGVFVCKTCADRGSSEPCCSCQSGEPSSVTTTTFARSTTTMTTTSRTNPQSDLCKAWCGDNVKPWHKKCTWPACSGCSECPVRRLRSKAFLP